MVNAELIFEAYLNAAIPYIDMNLLHDPIIHRWGLFVRNQSNQTLYFKLFNAILNWDFGTSLPGSDDEELGSIGAGGSSTFFIDMVREVPVGETYDDGNLTLKAYTDAGYSNEIASADKFVTIDIQDIENWADVTIYDFPYEEEACDVQGWTLEDFVCNQLKSVEAGGCSLHWSHWATTYGYAITAHVSRYITIPNRNKVSFSFFAYLTYFYFSSAYISVLFDGVEIFKSNLSSSFPVAGQWGKFSVNLSPYKGEYGEIKILVSITKGGSPDRGYHKVWLDRIVTAGKD